MSLGRITFFAPGVAPGGAAAVRWATAAAAAAATAAAITTTLAALQVNRLGAPVGGCPCEPTPLHPARVPAAPQGKEACRVGNSLSGKFNGYADAKLRQWRHMGGSWTLPEQMDIARHSRLTAHAVSAFLLLRQARNRHRGAKKRLDVCPQEHLPNGPGYVSPENHGQRKLEESPGVRSVCVRESRKSPKAFRGLPPTLWAVAVGGVRTL
jgi:hypothetical protein